MTRLLVAVWFLTVAVPGWAQPDLPALISRLHRSVVAVQRPTDKGLRTYCTAVVTSPVTVMTATHCLPDDGDVRTLWVDSVPALHILPEHGTLVSIRMGQIPTGWMPLPLRARAPRVGEVVVGLGYAFGDHAMTALVGHATHPTPYDEDAEHPHYSQAAWYDLHLLPGMSGGPIVDEQGNLLSINQGIAFLPGPLAWGTTYPDLRAFLKLAH